MASASRPTPSPVCCTRWITRCASTKRKSLPIPVPTAISSLITLPIYASVFDGVTCPSSAWIPKSVNWLETSKTTVLVGISVHGLSTITTSAPTRSALPFLTVSTNPLPTAARLLSASLTTLLLLRLMRSLTGGSVKDPFSTLNPVKFSFSQIPAAATAVVAAVGKPKSSLKSPIPLTSTSPSLTIPPAPLNGIPSTIDSFRNSPKTAPLNLSIAIKRSCTSSARPPHKPDWRSPPTWNASINPRVLNPLPSNITYHEPNLTRH